MRRTVSALLGFVIIAAGVYLYWQQTTSSSTDSDIVLEPDYKIIGTEQGLMHPGQPGGELIFATKSPLQADSPFFYAIGYFSDEALSLIHARLLDINHAESAIEPALASDWKASDDGKEIVFHLRRNVKFSDGQPLTAEDVVFVLNAVAQLEVDDIALFNDNFAKNIVAEAIDKWTVKVTSDSSIQLAKLMHPILPKHLFSKQLERLDDSVEGIIQLIEQTIDEQRQTYEYFAVDPVEAVDWALRDLAEALERNSVRETLTLEETLKTNLKKLADALTEEEPELKTQIKALVEEVEQLNVYASAARWNIPTTTEYRHLWTFYEPLEQMVGAGPFKIKEYLPDGQLVLSRNPHYWKKDENGIVLPYVEQVRFLQLNDEETELELFESGEIDLTLESANFPDSLKNTDQLENSLIGEIYPLWITDIFWWEDEARRNQVLP